MTPLRARLFPGDSYPLSATVAGLTILLLIASAVRDAWPW